MSWNAETYSVCMYVTVIMIFHPFTMQIHVTVQFSVFCLGQVSLLRCVQFRFLAEDYIHDVHVAHGYTCRCYHKCISVILVCLRHM